jgi:serine protease
MAVGGMSLEYKRPMSGGSHVLTLPFPMTEWQAEEFAENLENQGNVIFAEPDRRVYPMAAVTPNDTFYAGSQWHLQDSVVSGYAGAANLPLAWGETQGSSSIVVAVIDTGVLNHNDLSSRLIGGNASASGYDFINDVTTANDGNGRDSDPTDPGDWNPTTRINCPKYDSSWHGTHVAGTIGATSNNATGVTGVDWNAKLLTARVLGRCGGYTSDIVDAIAWSAGISVPNVPSNGNPAKVLNMSLGALGSCPPLLQTAINSAVARGAVVVAAAGNENTYASTLYPANCNNVINVTALTQQGDREPQSNYGTFVDIAAPGESIYSTHDNGITSANASNTYAAHTGTSMATAHVSGVVSLMLAAQPALSNGAVPAGNVASTVEGLLKSAARSFPATSNCNGTTLCGAGMLDAYQAVIAARNLTVSNNTNTGNTSGGGGGSLNLPTLFGLILAGILGLQQRHRRNNT